MIHFFKSRFKHIREKNEEEVTRLYYLYKDKFITYLVNNNTLNKDIAADIYQESFLIMHNHILSGKLKDTSDTNLRKYLFGIGYNKMLKHFEQQRKLPKTDLSIISELSVQEDETPEWLEKQNIIRSVIANMNDICKKILTLRYWEEKSMSEIAVIMHYKNEQGAKNQKYKCMRKLETLLKEIFLKKDLI